MAALPRVVIVYDAGAFPPMELAEAARDVCEIVWLTGWPGARAGSADRLLGRLGRRVDAAGRDLEELVPSLRAESPDGIAVFSDAALEPAVTLAEALGLPFHSRETTHRLRDKFAQRAALAAAGLEMPATRVLSPAVTRSAQDVRALGARWPAVLKPRRGTGSIDTFLVHGPDELLDALSSAAPDAEFVLEDFLPDRADMGASGAARLFSVELLVDGELIEPIVLTGRFPLKPPLRESGSFMPSDLGAEDTAAAVASARDAAVALGVERGILHVEHKLTPQGPRIIEINGRVGGLVPTLLTRIGGPPILSWALKLALGQDVGPRPGPPARAPVSFYRAWLPPVGDVRLTAVSGFPELATRAEIDQAWLNLQPGETVSSREGGGVFGYVAAAFGRSGSHEALWPLVDELEQALSLTFEPAEPGLVGA